MKNSKFINQWRETRELGQLNHILTNGLAVAFLSFIIVNLNLIWTNSFAETFFTKYTIYNILISFMLGAFIYAPLVWYNNERLYKKSSKEEEL